MPKSGFSHVIGIDDAPFNPRTAGNVLIVGAVFSATRLDGVLSTKVRKDGVNSTSAIVDMVKSSRFYPQTQAILLQGIALAGFNVVDIQKVHRLLQRPVLVVSRKKPDYTAIRKALLEKVPGGKRKWALIEQAGSMEKIHNVYVQRVGMDKASAGRLIQRLAINSTIPEPLRTAHLIAGGVVDGESRHRV
jgi:endonuclease V-like protein UPF0215 family